VASDGRMASECYFQEWGKEALVAYSEGKRPKSVLDNRSLGHRFKSWAF